MVFSRELIMNECSLAFNGERMDPVSRIPHLGNGFRAYNPVLMRFNCPDSWSPFGAGGINPWAYCAGDPVTRADPSGHLSTGQWIGMGAGLLAGIALSILTEGAAMPAVLTLMATMAGDAAIGAGAELLTDAVEGKAVNWGQVAVSAGLGAAITLAGAGVGALGVLGREFGQLTGRLRRVNGHIGLPMSGEFRNARFLGRNSFGGQISWNISFEDSVPLGRRLNIIMAANWEENGVTLNNDIWNSVRGEWTAGYFTGYQASGLRNALVPRDAHFAEYRLVILNSAVNPLSGGRSFALNFYRRANQPCSVTGYRGVPVAQGPVADALRQTFSLLSDMERYHFQIGGGDIPQNYLNGLSAQYAHTENAITFNGEAVRHPGRFRVWRGPFSRENP